MAVALRSDEGLSRKVVVGVGTEETQAEKNKAFVVAAIDSAAQEQLQSIWRIYWSASFAAKKDMEDRIEANRRFLDGVDSVMSARSIALELVAAKYGRS